MTVQLVQGRAATLDVVLRTDDGARQYPLRPGLAPGDVLCQLKRAGAGAWTPYALDGASWRDVGNGAYLLALGPADVEPTGALLVLLTGMPGLSPPLLSVLVQAEVVPARQFRASRPDLPQTVLVGQLAGQDGRTIVRATVTATLLETPLLVRGTAVAGDAVIGSSDDGGLFELPLLTGATVDLSIPAARYRRTLVVPPPPAPGAPVRLFEIP